MKGHRNVWAGTALALLMAAEPMQAGAVMLRPAPEQDSAKRSRVILVQEEQLTEEELLRKQQEEQQQEEAPAEQPAEEPAPAPEQAPAEAPAEEPAPEPQPEAAQPQPEAPAEPQPEAPAEPQPEAPAEPQPEAPAEPQAEQPEQVPAEEAAPEAPAEQPPAEQPPAEQPPAEQAPTEAPAAEPAPVPQEAPVEQPPAGEAPAAEQPATPEQPAAEPAPSGEVPAPAGEAPAPDGQAPAGEQPAAPAEAPAQSGEAPLPENAAPVLDSQKQQPPAEGAPAEGEQPAEGTQPAQGGQAAQPAEPAGPPPESDQAAQQDVEIEIQPAAAEEGTRFEMTEEFRRERRPERAEVVREIGDRVIIEINNQIIVESNEQPRYSRGAREVYYEELSRGRTREVVVRENGVQVITVRNRHGDVIRRSRIMPDGEEYILAYVDDERYEERYGDRGWTDPGDELPPMRLTIPVTEYILDAERVEDPDAYYAFLDQPPVERVERIYSVDEVKRSARIRDKTRRVDLDTITFEFGSASIPESEIARLEGVATAIDRLLKENPAETFLIEGHTDAVGTNVANLALSDRRAESVAVALSNVFGIPPENLTTQGYGEQYLKVRSQEPERENRRVAIRRITPLVTPVASAQ